MTLLEEETEEKETRPAPLTFWRVALAVMVGNLMAALVGGVLYLAATR